MPELPQLLPHLFRTEYSKLVAVLCKRFGLEHIEQAEDIASDTFLTAAETWPFRGIPPQPVAWLYTVAKNKARNHAQRNSVFKEKVAIGLKGNQEYSNEMSEVDLSEGNISDSQLQMMFAICHPTLSTESQVALALRILCGFGIEEIALAFLTNKETINKRIHRAKETLRANNIVIEFPRAETLTTRLESVLTILYLLFSEGYYSESSATIIRKDLCMEAIRLGSLLLKNQQLAVPQVHALLALMYFHLSRFDARTHNGEIVLYEDQDESLWNKECIATGAWHLKNASQGNSVTRYHLEATIAYWHTVKEDSAEKWENVLTLYNQLLATSYSPIAALNRTYALSKVRGNDTAIAELIKLRLDTNPYYHALLGELYTHKDPAKALEHLRKACDLTVQPASKVLLTRKINALPSDVGSPG